MKPIKWLVLGLGLILVSFLLWRGLRGQGIRMLVIHRLQALLDRTPAAQQGHLTNVIFLHHSTGRYLIRQGGVREQLAAAGLEFWDHDYNFEGLIRPDGARTGYSYGIPDDNTDPDGLARLFDQHVYGLPLNALSGLMQHEVIAFKSCFPASNITSQAQLEQYQTWYLGMRDVMDQHPEKVFIALTPPPLNPAATNAETAARARAFADWLTSGEFLAGHPNVFTFDFFDLLAERDPSAPDLNMLRAAYRDGEDSHPNERANQTVGPLFADFIFETVAAYRASRAEGIQIP
ncbi:MAG: hypothetical protein ACOYZ7_09565 [Chloroflexota bacterium]